MLNFIAENSVLRMLTLLGLFAVVAALAYYAASALAVHGAARRRLLEETSGPSRKLTGGALRSAQTEGAWLKLVNVIEQSGLSLADTNDRALRQKLAAAGFTAPFATRVFTLARLLTVVALPLLTLTIFWSLGATPSLLRLYISLLISAMLGLYLPRLYIRIRADRRKQEIINGFPDALDLLLVCVEAGLGLEAAFGRVGMEMTQTHPRLAEQFGSVVLELRAGRSLEDALRRMADRSAVEEIGAFATLLIQSSKLGSSIGQTLRVYASEMRERRRMRAEEKAHRLPVLLSIPLVACMLPVMIGVLMLPAVIRVMRAIVPVLSGD